MFLFLRLSNLVDNGKYYEQSKPSYDSIGVAQLISVREFGAKGDGLTDDTIPLQRTLDAAASAGKLLFVDAGTYRDTNTLTLHGGSRIIGESYPVIMSSRPYFADMNSSKAVIRVGEPGETGMVEWSDMVVATQGSQAGAALIEWNMASPKQPSGMWDVHTRIGGFTGSKLQLADCPETPGSTASNQANNTSVYSSEPSTLSCSMPEISLFPSSTNEFTRGAIQPTRNHPMSTNPVLAPSCPCTSPNPLQTYTWRRRGFGPPTTI